MYKISEISAITGVPVKTIRYYDEIGLISPAKIDEYTGYRYFSEENAQRLIEILYLKDLGFSLNEIAHFDEKTIKSKIKSLKNEMTKLKSNIKELASLRKNKKGEIVMQNLLDESLVRGKYKLLGLADTFEEAQKEQLYQDKEFMFENLYLLDKGKGYWVFGGWTKNAIIFHNKPCPYLVQDDKLYLGFIFDNDEGQPDLWAVYQNIDHKAYNKEGIAIKDDCNLPFVDDPSLIGFWEYFDYIKYNSEFNPKRKQKIAKQIVFSKFYVAPNGTLNYTDDRGVGYLLNWTKSFIINKNLESPTVMPYEVINVDGEDYLLIDWKSGNYIYGGKITGRYVLKRVK